MRIAITATGSHLDAEVDPRFGRCQYFIVVDPATLDFEAVENTNVAAAGGAGVSSGQMIASKGVKAVLTGNCGPNAYQVLSAAGIQIITGVRGKVREVIEAYKLGELQATSPPTVGAHFGMGGGRTAGATGGNMKNPEIRSADQRETQPKNQREELGALKTQSQKLTTQLEDIKRRINELEKKQKR